MKINEMMQARNEGMAYALRIAQQDGIDGLEKEIRYRNITGVSMQLTKKEMEEATFKMKAHSAKVAILISMVSLLEEFQFSKLQTKKFKERFDQNVEKIVSDEVDIQEYVKLIKEQYGIEILFKE